MVTAVVHQSLKIKGHCKVRSVGLEDDHAVPSHLPNRIWEIRLYIELQNLSKDTNSSESKSNLRYMYKYWSFRHEHFVRSFIIGKSILKLDTMLEENRVFCFSVQVF